ncbi:hypothetical protein CVT24_006207, partial [Panaeolus cyanescens]
HPDGSDSEQSLPQTPDITRNVTAGALEELQRTVAALNLLKDEKTDTIQRLTTQLNALIHSDEDRAALELSKKYIKQKEDVQVQALQLQDELTAATETIAHYEAILGPLPKCSCSRGDNIAPFFKFVTDALYTAPSFIYYFFSGAWKYIRSSRAAVQLKLDTLRGRIECLEGQVRDFDDNVVSPIYSDIEALEFLQGLLAANYDRRQADIDALINTIKRQLESLERRQEDL